MKTASSLKTATFPPDAPPFNVLLLTKSIYLPGTVHGMDAELPEKTGCAFKTARVAPGVALLNAEPLTKCLHEGGIDRQSPGKAACAFYSECCPRCRANQRDTLQRRIFAKAVLIERLQEQSLAPAKTFLFSLLQRYSPCKCPDLVQLWFLDAAHTALGRQQGRLCL